MDQTATGSSLLVVGGVVNSSGLSEHHTDEDAQGNSMIRWPNLPMYQHNSPQFTLSVTMEFSESSYLE